MKDYLFDFFKYNDEANTKFIKALKQLKADPTGCLRLMSHLINSQNKWLNRITKKQDDINFNWIGPAYNLDEIEIKWQESIYGWFQLLNDSTDESLKGFVLFYRADNGKGFKVKVEDIILQLNYHSIHHRAQISMNIRQLGLEPPVADYIYTVIEPV